jgi:hypothetical protein
MEVPTVTLSRKARGRGANPRRTVQVPGKDPCRGVSLSRTAWTVLTRFNMCRRHRRTDEIPVLIVQLPGKVQCRGVNPSRTDQLLGKVQRRGVNRGQIVQLLEKVQPRGVNPSRTVQSVLSKVRSRRWRTDGMAVLTVQLPATA